jgi:hypothetical protein
LLVALEEGRCACAKARYAASQAVASLEGASALLLRLCVALRPARHAEHSPQVVVLGEEGSSCCSCPSRRRGARVRQHGTRPLGQWHRRDERVHCCSGCVWPCGLHSTQSTHHRWWCLMRRARAVALALVRRRGARVRQHGTWPLRQWHRWKERVHCCCGYVWPFGLRGTQRTHPRWGCLGRRACAVALAPRGGEVRVCESTVRGLSGSGIAGTSECTAAAAVCGLAACTVRRALTTGGEASSSCCSCP